MRSMTRREILAITGTMLASTLTPLQPSGQSSRSKKKVIVAGAGIGGLCCAYELMRRGHEVTVLEAAGSTGGHVLTVRDHLADGLYVDAGAYADNLDWGMEAATRSANRVAAEIDKA